MCTFVRLALLGALLAATAAPLACSTKDAAAPQAWTNDALALACRRQRETVAARAQRCQDQPPNPLETAEENDANCRAYLSLPDLRQTPESLEQCARARETAPCDTPRIAECVALGAAADGVVCTVGSQCASGTCAFPEVHAEDDAGQSIDYPARCGRCAQPVGAGAPCGGAKGDFCDTGLLCRDGTCRVAKTRGEACDRQDCRAPLRCVAGQCADRLAVGGACKSSSECRSGLACAQGACAATTWVLPGEACDTTHRCASYLCSAEGRCAEVLPDGAPCDPLSDTATCKSESFCYAGRCESGLVPACR